MGVRCLGPKRVIVKEDRISLVRRLDRMIGRMVRCHLLLPLAAAMTAVGLGPGDEVLIPAHTYMASATSVLAAGAIPVIVDVDESVTIDPRALEDAIGPRTKAVVATSNAATSALESAVSSASRFPLSTTASSGGKNRATGFSASASPRNSAASSGPDRYVYAVVVSDRMPMHRTAPDMPTA